MKYPCKSDFITNLVRLKQWNLDKLNDIDNLISFKNNGLIDYFPLIYPTELEIKETSEGIKPISYLYT